MSKNKSKKQVGCQSLFIATKKGKILRINPNDIPLSSLVDKTGRQKSRKPTGIKLIDLKAKDEVVKIAFSKK